jgi:hypothetical protein
MHGVPELYDLQFGTDPRQLLPGRGFHESCVKMQSQ